MGLKLPNFLVGDLDSVRPSILSRYTEFGVQIVCTPDEDFNDFQKAVNLVSRSRPLLVPPSCAVVFGGLGGRMDQLFANLSVAAAAPRLLHFAFVERKQIVLLLHAGEHRILCVPRRSSRRATAAACACCASADRRSVACCRRGARHDVRAAVEFVARASVCR